MPADGGRRDEILDVAADLFATAGIRSTINDIAAACGMRPGSLYHHFASKDEILDALVDRHRTELDAIGTRSLREPAAPGESDDAVVALALEIASAAMRHRAALILDIYRRKEGSDADLAHDQLPSILRDALGQRLRSMRADGRLRESVDIGLLGELLGTAMLHIALAPPSEARWQQDVAAARCEILLRGLAVAAPTSESLDRSDAMRAAQQIVEEWKKGEDTGDDFVTMIRAVAQTEFARRGYGATTMRDIATAAGLSTSSMIYRRFSTKEELLASITGSFLARVAAAWEAVLASRSSAVEKLDALLWADINLVGLFTEEAKALLAWLRESPSTSGVELWQYPERLRELEVLVAEGVGAGELHHAPPADIVVRALAEFVWLPESVIRMAGGARPALEFARNTMIHGARVRD